VNFQLCFNRAIFVSWSRRIIPVALLVFLLVILGFLQCILVSLQLCRVDITRLKCEIDTVLPEHDKTVKYLKLVSSKNQ
jgi:hypothetical protein